jgi:cysteine desulfurase
VQSAGKIPVDVKRLGVDLLSLSAHKFYGPKGAGALFIRKGVELDPLLHGGQNERGRRAGTENVPAIVGFGKACELARQNFADTSSQVAALRDRLEAGLLARIPGARVNGDPSRRVPNTSSLMFPGADSESLVIALDLAGLACSAGAACSSGAVDPSHVLTAIGLTPAEARSSVRFSLGRATTPGEIDRALELIPAAVARQRNVASAREVASAR